MVKCTHTFRTVQICKCSRYPYQNWNPSRHIRLTDCCNPYTYFFLFQVYILMGLKKPKNQSRDHEHHFNCAYGKGKKIIPYNICYWKNFSTNHCSWTHACSCSHLYNWKRWIIQSIPYPFYENFMKSRLNIEFYTLESYSILVILQVV